MTIMLTTVDLTYTCHSIIEHSGEDGRVPDRVDVWRAEFHNKRAGLLTLRRYKPCQLSYLCILSPRVKVLHEQLLTDCFLPLEFRIAVVY